MIRGKNNRKSIIIYDLSIVPPISIKNTLSNQSEFFIFVHRNLLDTI